MGAGRERLGSAEEPARRPRAPSPATTPSEGGAEEVAHGQVDASPAIGNSGVVPLMPTKTR